MVNTSSCLFTVYLDPFCCCLSDNSFSGAIKETEICRPLPTFLNFTRRGQRTGSTKSCLPPHTNTATRQPSNWVDRYQSNRKPFHTPTHTHTHTHANIRTTTKGEIVPRYIPWVCLWVYILYVPWCEHYCDAPLRLFHLRSPLLIHAQACKHTHVNTHWHTHTHTHPAVQNLLPRLPGSSTTSLCCSQPRLLSHRPAEQAQSDWPASHRPAHCLVPARKIK